MSGEKTKQIKRIVKSANNIVVLRVVLIAIVLLVQLFVIFAALQKLNDYFVYFYLFSSLFGLCLSIVVVNQRSNPGYKIAWIILILFQPLFGTILYLILGSNLMSSKVKKRLRQADQAVRSNLTPNKAVIDYVTGLDPSASCQMTYLQSTVSCPAYIRTSSVFLSSGESKFERMKAELRKAEKFIFLEYFIISSGVMWDEILEILVEKAAAGVEVRVMYDDFGSLLTLPGRYQKTLAEHGIKSCVFGKLVPIWSVLINHRDHRKILVIDGKVGFTGGINLADEYINAYDKLGHWKDAAVFIEGEAVWSLTVFFLSSWGYVNNIQEDYTRYRPKMDIRVEPNENDGVVLPYLDSPLDREPVGANVYMNMIARATRYLYLETPYLIIDNEMMTALCNAAKQGVDVRIVTPGVGDHWYVHAVTRSNYAMLIESGVKIYEYAPGFIHAKVCVSDDLFAVVGTINLDYRSLYLHFENAIFFYRSSLIKDIYADFQQILMVSREITQEDCAKAPWYKRIGRAILKVFAPLM